MSCAGMTANPQALPEAPCDENADLMHDHENPDPCDSVGIEAVLDSRGIKEVRAALEILRELYEANCATGHPHEAACNADDIKTLKKYLHEAIGLNGRLRQFKNPQEQARKTVSKAIHRAMQQLFVHCRPLYDHFEKSLRIGYECAYWPTTEVDLIM